MRIRDTRTQGDPSERVYLVGLRTFPLSISNRQATA